MQDEIEAFLGRTLNADAQAKRIETHSAVVFLSGDRALKIKRAIKLPFLDFSTLEQRKAACEAELAVNKPFAPTIYRRVIPITREGDGTLKIDGAGQPVEWALDMARFDETATLDRFAERDAIDAAMATAVADAIANSHAKAAVSRTSAWVESIPAIIQQNADAFRTISAFAPAESDRLERLSRSAYVKLSALLARRNTEGFVRRCHGDLHLANVVLIDGKPVLFDAIEFDENLATIDVMHDLAFTLMDLIRYGCDDAANTVLNRYLEDTAPDNLEALALLPLFVSLRAAVRANIFLYRSAQQGSDQSALDLARSYFTLAQSALVPPPACVIAIGGLSGTGKTAAARLLAPLIGALPGAVVLRSDVLRKRMLGANELDRLPPSAYEPSVTAQVYAHLVAEAGRIARQGHSVIVDAVFAKEDERSAIEAVSTQAAADFVGIFLTADLEVRLQRIRRRSSDASDATAAVAEAQERYDLASVGWTSVDAGGTPQSTADLCAALLPSTSLRRTDVRDG
ncbi:AAA family ATPase [Bradyrhizobium sp. LHD-71]|uniref:bifunctional aminoglycoside phosphotransferase/ATP-binding protein n=1 Tax=Bradyrhizobium sp. LHD-71 TaxID=3072141 RepID=UPI00280D10D9|nr:AAA family ATPase [Bradyrhizobium sp. LHD-71]MDQ8730090.1 AAA family ATPase [Bradyrhizobium sp. LHD-71]